MCVGGDLGFVECYFRLGSGRRWRSQRVQYKALQRVRVAGDQFGSPTYVPHLLDGVEALLQAGCRGTVHMAGQGVASRFEWIQALFSALAIETPLEAGEAREFPQAATRPVYSALATLRDDAPVLPSWEEGVAAFAAART